MNPEVLLFLFFENTSVIPLLDRWLTVPCSLRSDAFPRGKHICCVHAVTTVI
ncbi:hypothetical protein F2P79_011816 [Pimephales promelas]|nr:hypothetical protein F2P79_011816 [Pimephales promelas]